MMKKLLSRMAIAGGVAALTIGATGAFFSDTETSTANTFEAGKVDLKIDSECAYYRDMDADGKYEEYECKDFGNWESADLTEHQFYNFADVKPGDWGENTISITVEDNDAWACMRIDNMENKENELIDPEKEAGDVTEDTGELAENLHFTAWLDQGSIPGWQGVADPSEGDNKWLGWDEDNQTGEPLLFSNVQGPASDVLGGVTYSLNGYGPLKGNETQYIGVQWCAGELTVDPIGKITCDGAAMGNEAQTDSLMADVSFYVEQARNNPNFSCDNVEWRLADK